MPDKQAKNRHDQFRDVIKDQITKEMASGVFSITGMEQTVVDPPSSVK